MKNLSKKEMTFVLARLEGKTMEDAFAEGYPGSRKWARSSRERNANEVMKRPHVKAYYDRERERIDREAAEEVRKKAIWDREKSLLVLREMIITGRKDLEEARAMKQIKPNAAPATAPLMNSVIRAVGEINKMLIGEYDDSGKSLARQLTDLNPDSIDEDPADYAVSVKKKTENKD